MRGEVGDTHDENRAYEAAWALQRTNIVMAITVTHITNGIYGISTV